MWHLRFLRLAAASSIVSVCLFSSASAQSPKKEDKADKMRHRLEQLFIWRVADRLGLSTQEEARFNEEFTKLTHEKSDLQQKLEASLAKIAQDKADKKLAKKNLAEYQSTLKKYNLLQTKEMEVLGQILGPDRMVEYVLLKQEMTQKIKDVLVQGARPASGPGTEKASLKEPEIIQEK
jgi:hypothetical protein